MNPFTWDADWDENDVCGICNTKQGQMISHEDYNDGCPWASGCETCEYATYILCDKCKTSPDDNAFEAYPLRIEHVVPHTEYDEWKMIFKNKDLQKFLQKSNGKFEVVPTIDINFPQTKDGKKVFVAHDGVYLGLVGTCTHCGVQSICTIWGD